MKFENSRAFAKDLDKKDSLRSFKNEFHFPHHDNKQAIYLCGNSLGLQPKGVKKFIAEELSDWASLGVEGHFHAKRPWLYYHKLGKEALANIVGAKPSEVVAMNQLTINLHLMLISFYQPTKQRFKIITEAGAFSSDQYAFESQMKLHKLDPKKSLIELTPREGEYSLRTEDILAAINEHADQLSLVIFGGIQYYSGQLFDIKKITAAAHKAGAYAGFDLAHAVGNVPVNLHKNNVDFAVWCSYKYLNSGPGSVAGAFVHENHADNSALLRLAGWWGHNEKERFRMKKGFNPISGVDGWQLSNVAILSSAPHLASLELFEKAGMKALRVKSILLTGFLEFLLRDIVLFHDYFTIITPEDPSQRGCQLSLLMKKNGRKTFARIGDAGIIADWREPDVIRIAPVPLYNSFEEVYKFVQIFEQSLRA